MNTRITVGWSASTLQMNCSLASIATNCVGFGQFFWHWSFAEIDYCACVRACAISTIQLCNAVHRPSTQSNICSQILRVAILPICYYFILTTALVTHWMFFRKSFWWSKAQSLLCILSVLTFLFAWKCVWKCLKHECSKKLFSRHYGHSVETDTKNGVIGKSANTQLR